MRVVEEPKVGVPWNKPPIITFLETSRAIVCPVSSEVPPA